RGHAEAFRGDPQGGDADRPARSAPGPGNHADRQQLRGARRLSAQRHRALDQGGEGGRHQARAMKLPAFEYAAPATLGEALSLLAANPGAKALAGGQSLIPTMAFRLAAPSMLVDLGKLEELALISVDASGVRLGARVRWRDIEDDARLTSAHPLLVEAISHVPRYQIRNRGTVRRSVAHADPAAEMPGIAVTCDAQIIVAGPKGTRTIAAGEFFTGALS